LHALHPRAPACTRGVQPKGTHVRPCSPIRDISPHSLPSCALARRSHTQSPTDPERSPVLCVPLFWCTIVL